MKTVPVTFFVKKYLSLFLVVFVFLVGCAAHPVTGKREIKLVSTKQEVALGKATAQQVVNEFGVYDDPELDKYINEVGQKLANVCERKKITYYFTVLDTPMVNAFAAPGGFIFVTRGILREMDDEAQLAGVVAHEIGHVVWRHGAKRLEKAFGYSAIILLGEILTKKDLSQLRQYTSFLFSLMLQGYSRKNEFEADNAGVRYSLAAGYDPKGISDFFEKLKAMEKRPPTKFETLFRSHPPTGDRIERIQLYLEQVEFEETGLVRNQEKFKRLTQNLPAEESPK
ncbi:MAG: M48 family metallopeptidase [bacterium]